MKLPSIDPITKAKFARELRVSPARVSQLVRRGLPTLPDGRVDADEVFGWVYDHVRTWRGGWTVDEENGSRRIDTTVAPVVTPHRRPCPAAHEVNRRSILSP